MLNKLPFAVLMFWLLAGLYFGIGGITRVNVDETLDNLNQDKDKLLKDTLTAKVGVITVSNQYELKYVTEYANLEHYFAWTIKIPKFTAFLITAMCFGLLGAVISIIKALAFGATKLNDSKWISEPLLGLLTGLVVLGLSYILPTLLTKGGIDIRPLTLMFLCLFCGIYTEKFYNTLSSAFDKIFKK
jgi:H+/Cl- antiporter ClcA